MRRTNIFILQREICQDSLASTREQSQVSLHNSKGGLTPFLQLAMFPKIPVTTGEETRVPDLILKWGPIPLLRVERNPNFTLAPQEEAYLTYGNSRGSPSSASQIETNPEFPTASWEEPRILHLISCWGLILLLQLERYPNLPLASQEEACLTYGNSRGSPSSPLQLKRSPEFLDRSHISKWNPGPCRKSRCGPFPLQWLERNPEFPVSLDTSPKTLMQLQRIPKSRLTHHNWRRALYGNKIGSLIPQLTQTPALPQISSSLLNFTTRKYVPSHYNCRGVTHFPIWEEHSTASRGEPNYHN